jgi:16S rRNA (uracil1498-N3)-methyltransferase
MPYFFCAENLSLNKFVEIGGEEARHILLAHRSKIGEKIKLQGPDGNRHNAEIVEIGKNKLKLKILEQLIPPAEPKVKITLFQAVVSEKALDFIFQKGTELGVTKIVLFNSANAATKLSSDQFKKKLDRWNKILGEAAKQSERVNFPGLEFVSNLDSVVSALKSYGKVFLADILGGKPQAVNGLIQTYAVVVGPEGGFTKDEVRVLQTLKNLQTVSLGPTVLRAETAALAIVAIIRSWAI